MNRLIARNPSAQATALRAAAGAQLVYLAFQLPAVLALQSLEQMVRSCLWMYLVVLCTFLVWGARALLGLIGHAKTSFELVWLAAIVALAWSPALVFDQVGVFFALHATAFLLAWLKYRFGRGAKAHASAVEGVVISLLVGSAALVLILPSPWQPPMASLTVIAEVALIAWAAQQPGSLQHVS